MYSRDIIFRPKYTSTNIKWAVTAAARPRHNETNSPSQNNKRADCCSFIDLWLSSLPTVLLPNISPSLQFWHPMEHIYLDLWKPMEICGNGSVSTRERQWGGRVEGGTNYLVTSFWEPHFERLFLAGLPGWRPDCGACQWMHLITEFTKFRHSHWWQDDAHANSNWRCRRETLQYWAAHLQLPMDIFKWFIQQNKK